MVPAFINEPLTDFTNTHHEKAFLEALARIDAERQRDWPIVIGDRRLTTGEWILSYDPSTQDAVGRVARAGREQADAAIRVAQTTFQFWARVPIAERGRALLRAASIMRRRKHELSATMVLEIGKTWGEADADTAEAIDFLEYYGRDLLRLAQPIPLVPAPGTDNELRYIPLGVGLIVPPWNFPCAILTGMTAAAIGAGNTVILKPASLTPVVAAKVVEIFEAAGIPPGVVNFLPGPGAEVGDYLVQHPEIRFVSFTGSREVGCHIYELAARVSPGQRWLKRVVAEMGGKDAIFVDDSWDDLDRAASDIVAAAFGFQGQKCSACSRLIATPGVYDRLLERVVARTRELRMGPPRERAVRVGPVADATQLEKITAYLAIGSTEGRLLTGGRYDQGKGLYVEPTVFADVAPRARIAQEEIFGPVLAVIRAESFPRGIAIANDTVYGLTGSVYARDPAKLAEARQTFRTGNLYLNRKCTGARVGVEPFGGFDMSGTCSRAGGPGYVELFMETKVISEQLG